MKVTKEMVQKLIITDVPSLDLVAVYLEDLGEGKGKITITCFGQSWTSFWGSMGEGHTIATFFSSCDNHYLAKKLSDIRSEVDDPDKLLEDMKKVIITKRKAMELTEEDARKYYGEVDDSDSESIMTNHDLLYNVYGDEWWCCLPKKSNHEYEYLCRIITAVKEALKV